ncbi:hypothetical protein [Halosimplex pelagicum]|uniref:Uncharacterized protein n=1 Tax=Halosimplex pelagicum TaxID=869886 RepID=A0A7D5PBQ9_9EURY|nr:hypothetical protein [Halosimplex pelagicum]QLH82462.1 hypothetical protein HZS54_12930 [Halosimplex pelagicum]QLH82518.1 hypothetical protein HZS54_13235 [Halosimplex pelagicum]
MPRDVVESALRRVHSGTLHNTTIDIYEPSDASYSPGDGYSVTYPEAPTKSGIPARADSPQPDADRDTGGTTADVDRVYRVRDDAHDQWTGFGEDGEAAVRIEDETATTYVVETPVDERNGLIRLECREV